METFVTKCLTCGALVVALFLSIAVVRPEARADQAQVCATEAPLTSECDADLCEQECTSGSAEGGACVDDACECHGCVPEMCSYSCEAARWDGGTCIEDDCICWG
jgi:hypothetical protein